MTSQEFLDIAKQNDAWLSPEQAEQSRKETMQWLERHQFHTGLFGGWYIVDTHSLGYKIYSFITGCLKFCFGLFLLALSAFLLFSLFF
jgi:hypothetical protein